MSRERMFNETISNIFKASLVGILVVLFWVIPLERFIAQFFRISFDEFGGGMPTLYLLPLFLIYTAMAFVLAKMKKNLNVSKRGAFFIIFVFHYSIVSFLPGLEGKIYLPDFPFFQTLVSGFILAMAVVSLIIFYGNRKIILKRKSAHKSNLIWFFRNFGGWVYM